MQRLRVFLVLVSIVLLAACSQRESSQASSADSNAPYATIVTRDGSTVVGTVTSSTPTEMTLNLDSGGSRTVLTKDIQSVQYGAAPAANNPAPLPNNPPQNNPNTVPQVARNQPAPAAPPAVLPRPDRTAIQTKTFEVPSGTQISVRNDEAIDSGKAVEGQTYAAEVTNDVRDANGAVVIPRGANAKLAIKSMSSGGKIKGSSELVLALHSVSVDGQQYIVHATDLEKQGSDGVGVNKRTGEYVGGGAALGAIIGAIAGGGKGAAIGAASGAGAGGVTQVLTKGNSVKIPAETLMTFELNQPMRVVERR
jgi:hypothetical protein